MNNEIANKIYKAYVNATEGINKMETKGQELSLQWYSDKMKETIQNRLTIEEMKQADKESITAEHATNNTEHGIISLEMVYITTSTLIANIKLRFKQLKEGFKVMDGYTYELNPYALTSEDKKYNIDLMQMLEED